MPPRRRASKAVPSSEEDTPGLSDGYDEGGPCGAGAGADGDGGETGAGASTGDKRSRVELNRAAQQRFRERRKVRGG